MWQTSSAKSGSPNLIWHTSSCKRTDSGARTLRLLQSSIFRIDESNSEFQTDQWGPLVRKSPVKESIQIVVTKLLLLRILCQSHHPPTDWHFWQLHMYKKIYQDFYKLQIANNEYIRISQCVSFVRKGSRYRHKWRLQIFPSFGSPDFVFQRLSDHFQKHNVDIDAFSSKWISIWS